MVLGKGISNLVGAPGKPLLGREDSEKNLLVINYDKTPVLS